MSRRCRNKVSLIGFVGKDPQTRYSAAGDALATLSLGTTETWKDKVTGEKKERTEWHRCVAFDKFAEEVFGKLPKKGSYISVEGKLQTRKWKDKNSGQDRYTTEIVADDLIMLDLPKTEKPPIGEPPEDDDIPF